MCEGRRSNISMWRRKWKEKEMKVMWKLKKMMRKEWNNEEEV